MDQPITSLANGNTLFCTLATCDNNSYPACDSTFVVDADMLTNKVDCDWIKQHVFFVYSALCNTQCTFARFYNKVLGSIYLTIGFLFLGLYLPVTIVLCQTHFGKHSCYRLLTVLASVVYSKLSQKWFFYLQIDILCLLITAIYPGFMSLAGIPYCRPSWVPFNRFAGSCCMCKWRNKSFFASVVSFLQSFGLSTACCRSW